MLRTPATILAICLVFGCRSSSESPAKREPAPVPESSREDSVSARQSFPIDVDGAMYQLEFDVLPGAWKGPYQVDGAGVRYVLGRQSLAVIPSEPTSFEDEVEAFTKLAAEATPPGEVRVVKPGTRVDLLYTVNAEGVAAPTRVVSVRPEASIPITLAVYAQSKGEGPIPDLEPLIASIRVSRK